MSENNDLEKKYEPGNYEPPKLKSERGKNFLYWLICFIAGIVSLLVFGIGWIML